MRMPTTGSQRPSMRCGMFESHVSTSTCTARWPSPCADWAVVCVHPTAARLRLSRTPLGVRTDGLAPARRLFPGHPAESKDFGLGRLLQRCVQRTPLRRRFRMCPLPPTSKLLGFGRELPGSPHVPSSWFLPTSTAFSTFGSAGLLHPAADPGVHQVPRAAPLPLSRPAHPWTPPLGGVRSRAPPWRSTLQRDFPKSRTDVTVDALPPRRCGRPARATSRPCSLRALLLAATVADDASERTLLGFPFTRAPHHRCADLGARIPAGSRCLHACPGRCLTGTRRLTARAASRRTGDCVACSARRGGRQLARDRPVGRPRASHLR
jgi:hypothetical protein